MFMANTHTEMLALFCFFNHNGCLVLLYVFIIIFLKQDKFNELQYIALFVESGFIKKLFSIDYVIFI